MRPSTASILLRVPAPVGGVLSFRRKYPKPFPRSAGRRRRRLPCALCSLRSPAERRSLASRPQRRHPWRRPFGLTWFATVLGSRYGYKNKDDQIGRCALGVIYGVYKKERAPRPPHHYSILRRLRVRRQPNPNISDSIPLGFASLTQPTRCIRINLLEV